MSNANLGSVGLNTQLSSCVQLGNGQSVVSTKMMATTVEAVMGAVYLDGGEGGLAAVKDVMQNLGIQYTGASTV
jgi:ribonuclease III